MNITTDNNSNETWSIFEELDNLLEPQERGGLVLIIDMGLAVISVVLNLIVITAIKENQAVPGVLNLVLGNLCLSNLTSAVLVKSNSIVHNGWVARPKIK